MKTQNNFKSSQICELKTGLIADKGILVTYYKGVQVALWYLISSVIRQKGESQNGCFKKTKCAKFSEKRAFLTLCSHTYVCKTGGKKCLFFGKFGVLSFLETPVLRFVLLPYYWRYHSADRQNPTKTTLNLYKEK